ncbi:MAG: hypothetical protein VKL41_04060 [Snowella sp.]|nr:hypothetical protein [Snowella sp.]
MNAGDVLLLVDDALYTKTGKRLNDLQRGVISGILNHQKYADIAEELDKSEGHVKDVGYELLKLLSSVFEEPVTKANLKSVLERQQDVIPSFGDGSINIDKNNIRDNVINCLNIGFDQTSKNLDNTVNSKDHKQKIKIQKLRDRGFDDEEIEEIAEILEIPLELVKTDE